MELFEFTKSMYIHQCVVIYIDDEKKWDINPLDTLETIEESIDELGEIVGINFLDCHVLSFGIDAERPNYIRFTLEE